MADVVDDSEQVDRAATQALFDDILRCMKAHYAQRPRSRVSVYEALNALAFAVAVTVTPADADAREFFDAAVRANVDRLAGLMAAQNTAKAANDG